MCLYPPALLSGLLLVLLVAELRDAKAIAHQTLRSDHQSTAVAQLADATVQTFHRGSGRHQLFWEATLSQG
ncbi:hypothetical protein [Stenomitos frigidus]|uniref:Uncharacterized protein n=1 Tax=Stenomitos frigidus ULC18 TaxID=2107698 RepID=A0A2T1DYT9_9CYAN|nr:hypothetical protein [Stenomitos frigidus]PSB25650.1 hypothetical protein C7B82_22805 [Stenomitos frigidus ULC18]